MFGLILAELYVYSIFGLLEKCSEVQFLGDKPMLRRFEIRSMQASASSSCSKFGIFWFVPSLDPTLRLICNCIVPISQAIGSMSQLKLGHIIESLLDDTNH